MKKISNKQKFQKINNFKLITNFKNNKNKIIQQSFSNKPIIKIKSNKNNKSALIINSLVILKMIMMKIIIKYKLPK